MLIMVKPVVFTDEHAVYIEAGLSQDPRQQSSKSQKTKVEVQNFRKHQTTPESGS